MIVPYTDSLRIPYVAPVPIDDVERRVIRACKTIRALPDPDQAFLSAQGQAMYLPIVHDDWFAYDAESDERPRFKPTPYDVSDVLVALAWCRGLARRDFKLVWWRSLDWSFRQMAMKLGRSKQQAFHRYRDIMLDVWQEAQPAVINTPRATI